MGWGSSRKEVMLKQILEPFERALNWINPPQEAPKPATFPAYPEMLDRDVYYGDVLLGKDGDTVVVRLDLGFGITKRITARLYGVACPELRDEGGREAYRYTINWLPTLERVIVEWVKHDKYGGREDCIIWKKGNPTSLNEHLILQGHGQPTDPGGRVVG